MLIAKSLISNPVAAEDAFTSRTEQSDVLLAAIPYSSISDSTITVSNSEIKDLYNKKKSSFEQPVETRNIKYIDVLVTPSEEDRKEVLNEVTEYANQLGTAADMNTFIRSTGSVVPFSEIAINKTVYPNDVVARLDLRFRCFDSFGSPPVTLRRITVLEESFCSSVNFRKYL